MNGIHAPGGVRFYFECGTQGGLSRAEPGPSDDRPGLDSKLLAAFEQKSGGSRSF